MEKGGRTEENSFGEFYVVASILSYADSKFFILMHVEAGVNACDGRACCSLMSFNVSYFYFNNMEIECILIPSKSIYYICVESELGLDYTSLETFCKFLFCRRYFFTFLF